MGTIAARKRSNGVIAYTAQIRLKRDGRIIHSEANTFDRKVDASAWLKRRETQLAEPGAIERLKRADPTLAEVIDTYLADSKREPGKTKAQVLRTIRSLPIGGQRSSTITSADIIGFAKSLAAQPQTVGNYMAHLSSIFAVARPAWGFPLDQQAMADALVVAKRLGISSKSKQRDRRPSLADLDDLMEHFGEIRSRRRDSNPMQDIVAFALFSTRRLEEITRIVWADLNEAKSSIWVRDMKHPGEKIGNDVRCTLPPEALRIILAQPRISERIFPASTDAISAAFTRACKFLGIDNLHFHDLRHEGISRLFEMGWTIPQAASVSGHRGWQSLKRYTHIEEASDKWANWPWLDRIAGCR